MDPLQPHSNSANAPLHEIAGDEARNALLPFEQRRQALLESLEKRQVTDDEDLRRAADTISLSEALREEADRRVEEVRQPYHVSASAVRNAGLMFATPLQIAERDVRERINAFRNRQREAAARAKNAQAEKEAELRRQAGLDTPAAAPIAAKDVRLPSARGDYRAQVYDRKTTEVKITNPRLLPDTVLKAPGVIAAMETAVRQLAKLTKDIPGAEVETGLGTSIKAG